MMFVLDRFILLNESKRKPICFFDSIFIQKEPYFNFSLIVKSIEFTINLSSTSSLENSFFGACGQYPISRTLDYFDS